MFRLANPSSTVIQGSKRCRLLDLHILKILSRAKAKKGLMAEPPSPQGQDFPGPVQLTRVESGLPGNFCVCLAYFAVVSLELLCRKKSKWYFHNSTIRRVIHEQNSGTSKAVFRGL
jgi:hypothetical protein